MTILTGVFFCTSLLSPEGFGFYQLFGLNMFMVFGSGSMGVIAGLMLCDAIYYGRLKGHAERETRVRCKFLKLHIMLKAMLVPLCDF